MNDRKQCSAQHSEINVGDAFAFDYPDHFRMLPHYSAHRGLRCKVLRQLQDGVEVDEAESGRMFRVRFADGFEADAFEDELVPLLSAGEIKK